MSKIIEYFEGKATDHKGRTLAYAQAQDNRMFECCHDFIQWMFPLHEKSYHATVSPVLSSAEVEQLRTSDAAKENMRKNFVRFCDFLGIGEDRNEKRIKWWAHDGNHNLLRITRAIRSLRLFGLDKEAGELVNKVWDVAEQYKISSKSLGFWKKAYEDDVWNSLTDDFLKSKQINIR